MNKAIVQALTYLNELEVHGERNCVLLVAAIKELKPLQTMPDPALMKEPPHAPDDHP